MLIDYLIKEFQKRQATNSRYSMRAFAKHVGLDPSTLSKILKRTRPLTAPVAKKILDMLKVEESLKSTLLLSLHDNLPAPFPTDVDFHVPPPSTLEWMSRWEFFAVLSVLEIPNIKTDAVFLAKRLNVDPSIVNGIIECLLSHELIVKIDDVYKPTGKQLTFPTSLGTQALKDVHSKYIDKSKEALYNLDSTVRDISGMTVAIDVEKFPEASRRITAFRRTLGKYLNSGSVNAVYRLNIQLFPLTAPTKAKKKT